MRVVWLLQRITDAPISNNPRIRRALWYSIHQIAIRFLTKRRRPWLYLSRDDVFIQGGLYQGAGLEILAALILLLLAIEANTRKLAERE